MKNVAIIGAGASGMFAGIVAAKHGAKVTIFEKNEKLGKKLFATGNGRCNITNRYVRLEHFHSNNMQTVDNILEEFGQEQTLAFFQDLGVEIVENEDGRIYPLSKQASIVVEQMEYALHRLGVEIVLGEEVVKIQKNKRSFSLFLKNRKVEFERVILSAGGVAASHLGGTESGYDLAKSLGHSIVKTMPSLVQLDGNDKCMKMLKGVRIDAKVSLYVNGKFLQSKEGDLLFTDYGFSGPTILQLSRKAISALEGKNRVEISIELLSFMSREKLASMLEQNIAKDRQKDLQLHLSSFIHKKIARCLLKESHHIDRVVSLIKGWRFSVQSAHGFKTAETTIGGVSMENIDAQNLESQRHKGLYFTGEVLDVDGDLGGYNLQWAWSSAYVAARAASS